ncbi:MAG: alpha-1,2-fucosyltransferase [Lewinellaceae bacterium]|nr:alpha-1,2-fucosyltransferase [Lewinellaceae bacterium]
MKKVIARIFGGLGNQLFIYATARALAHRTGAELVLDTQTGFRYDAYQRKFALNCFHIQFREATPIERFDSPAGRIIRNLLRRINKYLPFRYKFYLVEKVKDKRWFMPEILTIHPSGLIWIEGFWQSPRYFDDIRKQLVKELTIQTPLSLETRNLATLIQSSNSVCVHLRLVRHIVNGEERRADRNLDINHFLRCIAYMAQNLRDPKFFCFSDSPENAVLFRDIPHNITFVTHNTGDDRAFEDFYLMSLCRHFILSNSTFCWWPAWLNDLPDSIIISPPLHFWDNTDILPTHWITSDSSGCPREAYIL